MPGHMKRITRIAMAGSVLSTLALGSLVVPAASATDTLISDVEVNVASGESRMLSLTEDAPQNSVTSVTFTPSTLPDAGPGHIIGVQSRATQSGSYMLWSRVAPTGEVFVGIDRLAAHKYGVLAPVEVVLAESKLADVAGLGESIQLSLTTADAGAEVHLSAEAGVGEGKTQDFTAADTGDDRLTAGGGADIAFFGARSSPGLTVKVNDANVAEAPAAPTWEDDFEGALDTSSWEARRFMDANTLDGANFPENVSVVDGNLRLRMQKLAAPQQFNGKTITYSGGYVWSRGKHHIGYGKTEIRAKMLTPGSSTGLWSAIWFRDVNLGGEIDLFEAIGTPNLQPGYYPNDGTGIQQTIYKQTGVKTKGEYTQRNFTLTTPSDQWHTYMLEQTPQFIALSVDGVETFRTSDPKILAGFSGQIDIRFSQFIGESWGARTGPTTGAVNDVLIDYVKHWAYAE